jgi:hypothetical protein
VRVGVDACLAFSAVRNGRRAREVNIGHGGDPRAPDRRGNRAHVRAAHHPGANDANAHRHLNRLLVFSLPARMLAEPLAVVHLRRCVSRERVGDRELHKV